MPLFLRRPTPAFPAWRDRIALSSPVIELGRLVTALAECVGSRRRRPRLSQIAVPLEMAAALTAGLWWTLPILILCIWWWARVDRPWTWLVGVQSGAFGTLWTYSGATALAQAPQQRPLVAAIWIGCALSLAAVSYYNRSRNGSDEFYPGY